MIKLELTADTPEELLRALEAMQRPKPVKQWAYQPGFGFGTAFPQETFKVSLMEAQTKQYWAGNGGMEASR